MLRDLLITYRAATEGTGTNWPATYAAGSLVLSLAAAGAGCWFLVTEGATLRAARFLTGAVGCFIGWRPSQEGALVLESRDTAASQSHSRRGTVFYGYAVP